MTRELEGITEIAVGLGRNFSMNRSFLQNQIKKQIAHEQDATRMFPSEVTRKAMTCLFQSSHRTYAQDC